MEDRCVTCKHFRMLLDPMPHDAERIRYLAKVEQGECHRHAPRPSYPRPFPTAADRKSGDRAMDWFDWPHVDPDESCGEYTKCIDAEAIEREEDRLGAECAEREKNGQL